jgi:RNA polymerase sigma-70 factor (ECF subfamily)
MAGVSTEEATGTEERALFEAARQGSAAALDQILSTLAHELERELSTRRRSRRLGPAEGLSDVVQDTLIRVREKFDRFERCTFGDMRQWAGKIMFRREQELARNHRTHNRDDHKRKLLFALQSRAERDRNCARPDEAAAWRQEAAQAYALLQRMKPHEQYLIRLRVLEGLPFSEIAIAIRKSPDAVRKSYDRSIERLRSALEFPE